MATVPQAPGKWIRDLKKYLINDSKILSPMLATVGRFLNINRAFTFNILLTFVIMSLMFGSCWWQSVVSTLLVVPYALDKTCTVLMKHSTKTIVDDRAVDDLFVSLIFWIAFGSLKILEWVFWYVPFYYLLKTIFLLALCLPPLDMCGKFYLQWMKPLKYLSEKRVDRQVMLGAHPKLLKEMHIEHRAVRLLSDSELSKDLQGVKVDSVIKSLSNRLYVPGWVSNLSQKMGLVQS